MYYVRTWVHWPWEPVLPRTLMTRASWILLSILLWSEIVEGGITTHAMTPVDKGFSTPTDERRGLGSYSFLSFLRGPMKATLSWWVWKRPCPNLLDVSMNLSAIFSRARFLVWTSRDFLKLYQIILKPITSYRLDMDPWTHKYHIPQDTKHVNCLREYPGKGLTYII